MNEPIKAGDKCRVIRGVARRKSPNVGLEVTVAGHVGEHSEYGRVVRIVGDKVQQLHPDSGEFIVMGWADCPVAWLEKAPRPPARMTTKHKELTE
jgi:hypothetical protein